MRMENKRKTKKREKEYNPNGSEFPVDESTYEDSLRDEIEQEETERASVGDILDDLGINPTRPIDDEIGRIL